jgi:hypothetical protein
VHVARRQLQRRELLRHTAWLLAFACHLSPGGARADSVPHAADSSAGDSKLECISAATAGQTARADGKLLQAREELLTCARDVCPGIVKSHCARWLDELGERIPSIVVRAQDSAGGDVFDARLSIDGRPGRLDGHPVELDPGDHVVAVETASGVHVQGKVLLAEGEKARVIVLQVPVASEQSTVRTVTTPNVVPQRVPRIVAVEPAARVRQSGIPLGAWVLGAVGVAAGGAGIYFGVQTQSLVDSLRRPPPAGCEPSCTSSQTQPARTEAVLMTVSIGVAGAALGGAVLWALLAQGPAAPAATSLGVQPVAGGAVATVTGRY